MVNINIEQQKNQNIRTNYCSDINYSRLAFTSSS